MSQEWGNTTIRVLREKKDRAERGSCKGTSLMINACEVFLKTEANRPCSSCEEAGFPPGEQRRLRRERCSTDMCFVDL